MKKIIAIFLLIPFLAQAEEFDDLLKEHDQHKQELKKYNQEIQVYRLRANLQKIKTTMQKDMLECQKFGGCEAKTIYSPPTSVVKKVVDEKQKAEEELKVFASQPLPIISGITNDFVNLDKQPQQYRVGDIVYGVWLIKKITPTSIELLNKNNNKIDKVYSYWD